MLSFKQFIAENMLNEKENAAANADLIYQKILDVLDRAHIDFNENKIEFHIGKIIKNSSVDVSMVIRPSTDNHVKLGKNKRTEEYTIVVNTKDPLPERSEIDSFLAKNRERAQQVKNEILRYLRDVHVNDNPDTKTKYEEEAESNTSTYFEGYYETLIKQLKQHMEEYQGTREELLDLMNTEDAGKKETARMALKNLAKEHFGDNVEEFKKIAKKLMSTGEGGKNTEFTGKLSKENKEKLENRLESFYDQRVKPLLKQNNE